MSSGVGQHPFFGQGGLTPQRVVTTQIGWSPPKKDSHHPRRDVTDFQNFHENVNFYFDSAFMFVKYLTLITAGGDHYPPLENRVFSKPEHPVDPRSVCKLKSVCCGPVEKDQITLFVSV